MEEATSFAKWSVFLGTASLIQRASCCRSDQGFGQCGGWLEMLPKTLNAPSRFVVSPQLTPPLVEYASVGSALAPIHRLGWNGEWQSPARNRGPLRDRRSMSPVN